MSLNEMLSNSAYGAATALLIAAAFKLAEALLLRLNNRRYARLAQIALTAAHAAYNDYVQQAKSSPDNVRLPLTAYQREHARDLAIQYADRDAGSRIVNPWKNLSHSEKSFAIDRAVASLKANHKRNQR